MSIRILVVDDVEIVRNILRGKLESCGYEVVEASDGQKAIRRLDEGAFDVVISGAGDDLYLDNARGLGASRVFAKPFALGEIAAAVKELASA
ncbi:MAG: response regulator [Planctomycetes bacterium]|nr:response regulator [Planctomycetota bacterium]